MIQSPAAQPRSSIIGHLQSAIIGVGIQKLFSMSGEPENLRLLVAALSVGLASASMVLTKTVYPPGGATALLAVVDPAVQHLGWYLVALVMLSTTLTLLSSLVVNNIQRQYPIYWWTAADVSKTKRNKDIEKSIETSKASLDRQPKHLRAGSNHTIQITERGIILPQHMELSAEEKALLQKLKQRLAVGIPTAPTATLRSYSTAQLRAEDEKRMERIKSEVSI